MHGIVYPHSAYKLDLPLQIVYIIIIILAKGQELHFFSSLFTVPVSA
jgi:hypothetical protein